MTDPDPGRSQLPSLYTSPWSALGRDLIAVLASLRLKAQELWRRNRQADLIVPGFWPRALAPLFWPLLLLLALLGLTGVVVGLRALGPRAVPPAAPVAAPLQPPITPAGSPGQAPGLPHSPAAGSTDSPSSRTVAPEPAGERRGARSPATPSPATPSTRARSAGTPSPSPAPPPSRPPSAPSPAPSSAPPGAAPPDSALSEPSPPAIEPLLELLADLDPQQLIRVARPHPASGTLELELDARLDRLNAQERQQQANLWLERARALGYDNLELSDGDGLLMGRPAWVGGGMILLDHQAGG
ncbi:hypothetical protein KBZ19_10170 [Synechococcus sp. L2F]|uniref:hypothetical protein n=1 Tax=Synechococcus sp. L2F TaxID=2823739 RepID=UPI0020CF131D|nr:hypothetical protein [Synechococcus sp. L2F]MCP9828852.1 hypothetical protein [Synechococcus sp. L2F]